MSLNRSTGWLAAWVVVLAAALPASAAQGIGDFQLFAPAETSTYGGRVRPNEGLFFNLDLLYWSIAAPEEQPVGFPNSNGRLVYYGALDANSALQFNTLSTGFLKQDWAEGERFEIGDRWGHYGWILGTLRVKSKSQSIVSSGVDMIFDDPVFGPNNRQLLEGYFLLPSGVSAPPDVPPEDQLLIDGTDPAVIRPLAVTFDDFQVRSKRELWGVEWMGTYRTHPHYYGGIFEFYYGVRYMEFDNQFSVQGLNDFDDTVDPPTISAGGALGDSDWVSSADNHIVGPQVAIRWFTQSGRWTLDASGRFLAGFNYQNMYLKGTLGSRLTPPGTEGRPLSMSPTSFTHAAHENEWSPTVEFRANLQYQLTRAIALRFGWTGMYIDGVARSPNIILYQVPNMGLNIDNNREGVFMHAVTGGVTVNY